MQHWGCVAKVTRVSDGGLAVVSGDGRGVSPPVLILEIAIPMEGNNIPKGQELTVPGMFCVVNPAQDAMLDKMMRQ